MLLWLMNLDFAGLGGGQVAVAAVGGRILIYAGAKK
jgi:hypothetical protein